MGIIKRNTGKPGNKKVPKGKARSYSKASRKSSRDYAYARWVKDSRGWVMWGGSNDPDDNAYGYTRETWLQEVNEKNRRYGHEDYADMVILPVGQVHVSRSKSNGGAKTKPRTTAKSTKKG